MPRAPRAHEEGAFYHIRNRGHSQQPIFLGDGDRRLLLALLSETIHDCGWHCHCYCLMTNHYHLVIETPVDNVSSGMQYLNGRFTQLMNRRHQRTGQLFEGRFRSKLVEDDPYLLVLTRYVLLNPVAAGLVDEPRTWPWSSYRDICSGSVRVPPVDCSMVLSYFSNSADPRREFERYILDGVEDARTRPGRPSLASILVTDGSRRERAQSVRRAFVEHGYSHREIARFLDVHHTTIGRMIAKQQENAPQGSDPPGAL